MNDNHIADEDVRVWKPAYEAEHKRVQRLEAILLRELGYDKAREAIAAPVAPRADADTAGACVHADDPKACYRVRCQLGNKCVDDDMSFRKSHAAGASNERADADTAGAKQQVTLTGAQLLEAFNFVAPDHPIDPDQLECEVTIAYGEGHDGKGHYCWLTDHPEEGSMLLDGKASESIAAGASNERADADTAGAKPSYTDEQIARAWFDGEYGPGHTRAPGYVYTFLEALNAAGASNERADAAPTPSDKQEAVRFKRYDADGKENEHGALVFFHDVLEALAIIDAAPLDKSERADAEKDAKQAIRIAISVFDDVQADIADWEDKALSEAVASARAGLRAILAQVPRADAAPKVVTYLRPDGSMGAYLAAPIADKEKKS
jgi:hypothetical protein